MLGLEEVRCLWAGLPEGINVEIEIGCGNGHFISAYGARHPERLLVGVDIKAGRCGKALHKINRLGLSNTHIACCRAEEVVNGLAESSVDGFHFYFPDPWPKNKHRRRRFLRMANLQLLQRSLKPGGDLHFVTDFFDYFLHTKIILLLQGNWSVLTSAPPDEFTKSMFSRRFTDLGKNLFHLHAKKKS